MTQEPRFTDADFEALLNRGPAPLSRHELLEVDVLMGLVMKPITFSNRISALHMRYASDRVQLMVAEVGRRLR